MIKNISDLVNIDRSSYYAFLKNYPDLLKKHYPKYTTEKNKIFFLNYAKKGNPKPTLSKNPELFYKLQCLVSKSSLSYDEKFRKQLEKYRPDWFDQHFLIKKQILDLAKKEFKVPCLKGNPTKKLRKIYRALRLFKTKNSPIYDKMFCERLSKIRPHWLLPGKSAVSFENMILQMPKNVKFKSGQKWTGAKRKYWFICSKYGSFKTSVDSAKQSWKKGSSGHFLNIKDAQLKIYNSCIKPVKNLDTGKIFKSARDAERFYKIHPDGVARVCRKIGKTAGGYRWAYVD